MEGTLRRTVVVSAVNLRKGGTLTILRNTLSYLSERSGEGLRVIALVHSRSLCDYPGIEYIELPWCIRSWAHRLWAEYVTMHRISERLRDENGSPVDVWLSLHDTSPRVLACRQEVYCHTSFMCLKLRLRDFLMDPKVPIFAMLTRWIYRINVHSNDSIIVQQNWFADALSRKLGVPREKFRVIPPVLPDSLGRNRFYYFDPDSPSQLRDRMVESGAESFFFASTPDCHKNFETLCEAARLMEAEGRKFTVTLTIDGTENRYSRWLKRRWGSVGSIVFRGFMPKEELFDTYRSTDCFVFPSRVETWGLPISEFRSVSDRPLILSDLPYAHENENIAIG